MRRRPFEFCYGYSMKILVLSLALAVAVAIPALADDDKDKLTAAERRERTEIWLETQKRRNAARVDRLIGSDTYTRALERRQRAKPKRDYRRSAYPELWRELERLDYETKQARERAERKTRQEAGWAASRERIRAAMRRSKRARYGPPTNDSSQP